MPCIYYTDHEVYEVCTKVAEAIEKKAALRHRKEVVKAVKVKLTDEKISALGLN